MIAPLKSISEVLIDAQGVLEAYSDEEMQETFNGLLQLYTRFFRLSPPTTDVMLVFEIDNKFVTNNEYLSKLQHTITDLGRNFVLQTVVPS